MKPGPNQALPFRQAQGPECTAGQRTAPDCHAGCSSHLRPCSHRASLLPSLSLRAFARSTVRATLIFLSIFAAAYICSAADPTVETRGRQLTAEQAKDALLRFIRANRATFIGNPDPDKLAAIPVKPGTDGYFWLGAFRLDLSNHKYSADIGFEGPEPYHYYGSFVERDGTWTAEPPSFQRFHRLPGKLK